MAGESSWRTDRGPTWLDRALPRVSERVLDMVWRGRTTEQGYKPSRSYRWLHPGVSGNRFNGLGERVKRRAGRILWTRGSETPFGVLQRWFLMISGAKGTVTLPQHLVTRRLARREAEQMHVAPSCAPVTADPGVLFGEARRAALAGGADLVGAARMQDAWVFDGVGLGDWADEALAQGTLHVLVVGVEMDYAAFGQAPALPAATEAMLQYDRGTAAALDAADALIAAGYRAYGHGGPRAGRVLLIPAAVAAGMGVLGKHGSLITREFGASMRLACVVTDAPLASTSAEDFGAEDLCARCQICTRACPTDAIANDKQWVRGEQKYYVDFDRCLPFFMENNGCGICAAQCPYSKPEVRPRLLSTFERRRGRA